MGSGLLWFGDPRAGNSVGVRHQEVELRERTQASESQGRGTSQPKRSKPSLRKLSHVDRPRRTRSWRKSLVICCPQLCSPWPRVLSSSLQRTDCCPFQSSQSPLRDGCSILSLLRAGCISQSSHVYDGETCVACGGSCSS